MIVLRAGNAKLRIDELAFAPDGAALYAPGSVAGVCRWGVPWTAAKATALAVPVPSVTRVAVAADGTVYAGNDRLAALDPAAGTAAPLPIVPWHTLWFAASPADGRLVVSEEAQSREACRLTGWAAGGYATPEWEETVGGLVWSRPMFLPGGREFVLIEHYRAADRQWFAHRVTRSAATGAALDRSPPLADIPEQVALSPDGRTLACRTREVVRFYPAAGPWAAVPQVANDSKKHFTGVGFHPSGRFLAATSNDTTVKLYDTATWGLATSYTWAAGRLRSVAFSPDGTLAAAGGDGGKVVLWDVDL